MRTRLEINASYYANSITKSPILYRKLVEAYTQGARQINDAAVEIVRHKALASYHDQPTEKIMIEIKELVTK